MCGTCWPRSRPRARSTASCSSSMTGASETRLAVARSSDGSDGGPGNAVLRQWLEGHFVAPPGRAILLAGLAGSAVAAGAPIGASPPLDPSRRSFVLDAPVRTRAPVAARTPVCRQAGGLRLGGRARAQRPAEPIKNATHSICHRFSAPVNAAAPATCGSAHQYLPSFCPAGAGVKVRAALRRVGARPGIRWCSDAALTGGGAGAAMQTCTCVWTTVIAFSALSLGPKCPFPRSENDDWNA